MTSMTSLLLTLNIFDTFFSVSIVDFEEVNACWGVREILKKLQLNKERKSYG